MTLFVVFSEVLESVESSVEIHVAWPKTCLLRHSSLCPLHPLFSHFFFCSAGKISRSGLRVFSGRLRCAIIVSLVDPNKPRKSHKSYELLLATLTFDKLPFCTAVELLCTGSSNSSIYIVFSRHTCSWRNQRIGCWIWWLTLHKICTAEPNHFQYRNRGFLDIRKSWWYTNQ